MSIGELPASLRKPEYDACIEACSVCWMACEACADACLDEDDLAALVTCIRLTRDCA